MLDIKTDACLKVGEGQAVVEGRLTHTGGIIKVLSLCASCAVAKSEVFSGEARYSGAVTFKVIALTDSGCVPLNCVSEFTDKVLSDRISDNVAFLQCAVVDTAIEAVTDTEVRCQAVVNVSAFAVKQASMQNVGACDGDIFSLTAPVDYYKLKCMKNDTAFVTDALEGIKAIEVENYSVSVAVDNVTAITDGVTVDGKIYCFVTMRTPDNLLCYHKIVTPFTKEIVANNAQAGDLAIVNVTNAGTTCSFAAGGEEGDVKFEYSLVLDTCVYGKETCSLVTDAFCSNSDLAVKREDCTIFCNHPFKVINDVADATINLDGDRPAADNVLAPMISRVEVAKAIVDGGKLYVDGVITGDIIYYNADANTINAQPFDLPFSFEDSTDFPDDADLNATACLTDINVKVRRESVFDIKAGVRVCVNAVSCQTMDSVVSVERENACNVSAVAIHVAASGDTVWDNAKALRMSPEQLLEFNPDLPEVCKGGERVIAYRQIKR